MSIKIEYRVISDIFHSVTRKLVIVQTISTSVIKAIKSTHTKLITKQSVQIHTRTYSLKHAHTLEY